MNNSTLDAGIPVLTEIIPAPQPGPQTAAPGARSSEIAVLPVSDDIAALRARATADWDDEKWDRMEREIRERVLHQVLERIDFVLEQRVRDSLADVLQTAVERLAVEIRSGLHQTVKEVVTRAVSQEITKLQTTKK
jgi:protein required for attachment to host cells